VDAERAFVAVVNETFARTFFPGEDPVGRSAARVTGGSNMREIVGVVADVRQTDLTSPPQPIFYTHAAQEGFSALTLVVRSSLPTATLAPSVRAALREVDAEIAVARVTTMRDVVTGAVAHPRFYATVLGAFAAMALLLAALGLYAMLSQHAGRRRRELGVRLALGARPVHLVRLVVAHGMRLTLIGVAAGLVAAWGTTRLVASMLYDVRPGDAVTWSSVILLLAVVALLASALPAARAARLDPVRSLRG
jgi:ABC-type antimicrobial peptide transport system permease subunit